MYGSETADKAIQEFQKETDLSSMNSTAQNYQSFEVDSAPIVRLVNSTIELAVSEGASDIY